MVYKKKTWLEKTFTTKEIKTIRKYETLRRQKQRQTRDKK